MPRGRRGRFSDPPTPVEYGLLLAVATVVLVLVAVALAVYVLAALQSS